MQSQNLNAVAQDESGDFQDINFKLLVIEDLCHKGSLRLYEPEAADLDQDGEVSEDALEPNGVYTPALDFYAALELTEDQLSEPSDLVWDAGSLVFSSIAPRGIDDTSLFELQNFEADLELLPHLESIEAPLSDEQADKLSFTHPFIELH